MLTTIRECFFLSILLFTLNEWNFLVKIIYNWNIHEFRLNSLNSNQFSDYPSQYHEMFHSFSFFRARKRASTRSVRKEHIFEFFFLNSFFLIDRKFGVFWSFPLYFENNKRKVFTDTFIHVNKKIYSFKWNRCRNSDFYRKFLW